MNNNEKNTALYEKMAAEQDIFRDWLKSQVKRTRGRSCWIIFTELSASRKKKVDVLPETRVN